jgi:hypothetical protein
MSGNYTFKNATETYSIDFCACYPKLEEITADRHCGCSKFAFKAHFVLSISFSIFKGKINASSIIT